METQAVKAKEDIMASGAEGNPVAPQPEIESTGELDKMLAKLYKRIEDRKDKWGPVPGEWGMQGMTVKVGNDSSSGIQYRIRKTGDKLNPSYMVELGGEKAMIDDDRLTVSLVRRIRLSKDSQSGEITAEYLYNRGSEDITEPLTDIIDRKEDNFKNWKEVLEAVTSNLDPDKKEASFETKDSASQSTVS